MKFKKNYGKWFINDVRRVIEKYQMIEDGEKVAVALSGGKDSSLLLWILAYLKKFSNMDFKLYGVHVKSFVDNDSAGIRRYCEYLGAQYLETEMELEAQEMEKSACYMCSRIKRGALQKKLLKHSIKKVCYGHHASDVAETFFMNLFQNKKLGSFSPLVATEESSMVIVRPMICLDADKIQKLVKTLEIPTFDGKCAYGSCNIRSEYRELIPKIESLLGIDGISGKIVDSLENIDKSNIWENVMKK